MPATGRAAAARKTARRARWCGLPAAPGTSPSAGHRRLARSGVRGALPSGHLSCGYSGSNKRWDDVGEARWLVPQLGITQIHVAQPVLIVGIGEIRAIMCTAALRARHRTLGNKVRDFEQIDKIEGLGPGEIQLAEV